MNKYFIAFTGCFLIIIHLQAQSIQSHQSQPPPNNPGYPFVRGMYVDCTSDIITDISNGNPLGLEQELTNYISNNSIGYIILRNLENSNVFGDPNLENALRTLMHILRVSIPGIKIGIEGSSENFFQNTDYLHIWERFGKECYPVGAMHSIKTIEEITNDQKSRSNLVRSELCKFFIQAERFGKKSDNYAHASSCESAFDVLYVKYPYWQHTNSLIDMQIEFNHFKDVLYLLQALKCQYNCTGAIDAEFLPSEIFNLQGWTAIDQITDIDPFVDRLMVPTLTNVSDNIFDFSCKTMHFLTDPFSKAGTRFFIELSAESPLYNYCNSIAPPNNYLGDYLDGLTNPSGNMYSVEKKFLDKFNDPLYFCTNCQCQAYMNNHFSTSNKQGNILSGIMWGPYSMLKDHNLFKTSKGTNTRVNQIDEIELIQLFDLEGKLIFQSKNSEKNTPLPIGLYLKIITYKNGKTEKSKIFLSEDQTKNIVPAGPRRE
jgi:hypothetical protein